jgi:hypothetical protein
VEGKVSRNVGDIRVEHLSALSSYISQTANKMLVINSEGKRPLGRHTRTY